MYYFLLDLNAEPWAIGDVGIHRKGGKVGAHVGQNTQLNAFQQAVREELQLESNPLEGFPLDGSVILRFWIWRQQADYEAISGKRVRKHQADATNMQKGLEDALQGLLFVNDSQVRDIHTTIVDQGSEVTPLILIGVDSHHREGSSLDIPDWLNFRIQNKLAGNLDLFHTEQSINTELF